MVHELNCFFDKIFIISIKRNSKRLELFLKENPLLNVEIYTGVDGHELYPEIEYVHNFPQSFFKENKLDYDRCKTFNKGQLGCALSNRNVQERIVDLQISKTLILEDDAFYFSQNINIFKKAINELPSNWELFYLGYNPVSRWSENVFFRLLLRVKYFLLPVMVEGNKSSKKNKRFLSVKFSPNLNLPGIYTGTHAYALSYNGAIKTLSLDTPLKFGYDTLLMHANFNKLLKAFSLRKPLFFPNKKFETTLTN